MLKWQLRKGEKTAKAENLERNLSDNRSLQLSPRLQKIIHIQAAPL